MKNNLFADVGYLSLNKQGEQLCGDMVEVIRKADDELIVVLADGLGSGVKANILSTLTSKIISTMVAAGMSIDDCVATIAATLPVCQRRGVAYSTFTIMRFIHNEEVEMIQFDNPMVILLRDGKHYDYPVNSRVIEGKTIHETRLKLQLDDGMGGRQVVSGIAPWYKPEDLIGKKIVLVANLKPAKLCGVESCGMICAADMPNGDVKVIFPDESLPVGSKIR